MKFSKFLVMVLTLTIIIYAVPTGVFDFTASAATSGKTGGCTWSLNGTTLTISGNGAMADYSSSSNLPWGKNITEVVIGNDVTSIGYYAFYNCNKLTSVTIPNSVTSIGSYAFDLCTSLTSITIPNSVTIIGNAAFADCISLTSITIPNSVTSIGDAAFRSCDSLTSIIIPDSVTSINDYTFYYCTSLTSITIPDSVTSIGKSAFGSCSSLTSITIPKGVTSIDDFAFDYCSSLTSIIIPNSITSIGDYAFSYCYSLKRVDITDLDAWYKIEFSNLWASPIFNGGNLYFNNQLVTDLIVPQKQIIDEYLYYNYKSIKNVFLPNGLVLIQEKAFYGCSAIENVYFEGTADEWTEVNILSGNDYLKNANVYFNCTGIPEGLTSIEIAKLPEKLQYIQSKESLDLTGGVLTLYYDGGASNDIALDALNVENFDNTILGKQIVMVKYGAYSAQFEIEVIARSMTFVAVSSLPTKREYKTGETLDLTGAKLVVGCPEGNYEIFDITLDMISGYDNQKVGYQILTVNYKGYKSELIVRVFLNGDLNGDDKVNATDVTLIITNLLKNCENKTRFDINQDDVFDLRDLVRLKRALVGVNVPQEPENTETPSINPITELKLNTTYYHIRNEVGCSYLTEFQFDGSQLVCNALYGTNKEFAEIDIPIIYKGTEYYPYGFGGPLPEYTLTDEEIILEYGEDFLGYPEYNEKYRIVVTPTYDLLVTYSSGWLFDKGDILELTDVN